MEFLPFDVMQALDDERDSPNSEQNRATKEVFHHSSFRNKEEMCHDKLG